MFVLCCYLCRCFFLTMQGQCKPNAESSLYAEVQPVLAISIAKLRRFFSDSKKNLRFFSNLYGQTPHFRTNGENRPKSCPKGYLNMSKLVHDTSREFRKLHSSYSFRWFIRFTTTFTITSFSSVLLSAIISVRATSVLSASRLLPSSR